VAVIAVVVVIVESIIDTAATIAVVVVPYRHSYTSIEHTKFFALSHTLASGSQSSLTCSRVVVVVENVVPVLEVDVIVTDVRRGGGHRRGARGG